MGKRQRRRTTSLRPEIYIGARQRARALGIPLAAYIERLISDDARRSGWWMPDRDAAIEQVDREYQAREQAPTHGGGVFTW